MRIVVTGASGHLGANVTRKLLDQGAEVVAADLIRGEALEGLGVDFQQIDVLEPDTLRTAFAGADAVIHLVALISIAGDPTGMVHRVNVEGARNSADAALECGVQRFVHCSSVHAFDLERCGPSLDEIGPPAVDDHAPAYDRSKYSGELAVQDVIDEGLNAVIVNPTGMIGPHDYAPSRMGAALSHFQENHLPLTLGGGFDFVDVRDVAVGVIAALESGTVGENYLLSGTWISMKALGQLVAQVSGCRAPVVELPLALVEPLAGPLNRFLPSGEASMLTRDALHALRYSPIVNHYKAARELGYAARPIHQTVRDTLEWFDAHSGQSPR